MKGQSDVLTDQCRHKVNLSRDRETGTNSKAYFLTIKSEWTGMAKGG